MMDYFTQEELNMALDQIKRIEAGLLTPAWTDKELKKSTIVINDFKTGKINILTE